MSAKKIKKRPAGTKRFLFALAAFTAVCIGLTVWNMNNIERKLHPVLYEKYVQSYAKEFSIDPMLIYAVIYTESGFDPAAVSNIGARGLMQITEETFAWIKLKNANDEPFVYDDMFNPETNIRFGSYFLSRCAQRYSDLPTAIAAYHSGWATVDGLLKNPAYSSDGKTLHTFPYAQMELYVQKVTKAYNIYHNLYDTQ